MRISQEQVNQALEIIDKKKPEWTKRFPKLQFDKYGRANVAELPSIDSQAVEDYIFNNGCDPLFMKAFNLYLKDKEISIQHSDSGYYDYLNNLRYLEVDNFIDNYFHFMRSDGSFMKIKASKVLAKVQNTWENDYCLIYKKIKQSIKELRKKGATYENSNDLRQLYSDKKYYEQTNPYCNYQKMMNECKGTRTVCITINPLDLLTSSGGYGETNPTKFSSCWSNRFDDRYLKESGCVTAVSDSCYASPQSQFALGSILNRAIMYIPNGNTLKLGDFEFIGYKERTHIWFDDCPTKILLESIYPSRSRKREKEYSEILNKLGIECIDNNKELESLDYEDYQRMDFQDVRGARNYINIASDYGHIFLDRIAIDEDYEMWMLPMLRTDYDYENPDRIPNEGGAYCSHCEERCDPNEMTMVANGETVCQYCLDSHYYYCENCDTYHFYDDGAFIDDYFYCDNCITRIAYECEECGELHLKDNGTEVKDQYDDWVMVCEHCLENYYLFCEECEDYHHSDCVQYVDSVEIHVCDECLKEYYTECEECGEYFENEEIKIVGDKKVCESCEYDLAEYECEVI